MLVVSVKNEEAKGNNDYTLALRLAVHDGLKQDRIGKETF